MDFHSLPRRDLQALCKLNAIPANKTNLAMADALTSLDIVQGIEDFLNRSPERKAVTAAKVRRTTTRSKPIGNGSGSVQPMMTQSTRRTARKGISDEIMAESKTPAIRNTVGIEDVEKKDVSGAPALATYNRRNQKVSTVQRVYSTRRSARLTESIAVEEKEEKIDSLVSELSRIDLGDVSDDKTLPVLQESAEKVDVVALETVNDLKDDKALDEFNAVQEDNTKSVVTENKKEGVVQEDVDEELEESESGEKVNLVALETVNNLKVNEALDDFNAVQEDNTKSVVTENKKEGDVQEDIGEESEQPQFVADCKEVLGYPPVDTENCYEQTKSDEAAAPESGTEFKGNDDQIIVVNEVKEKSHFVNEVNSKNVIIADENSKVEKSLMDSDNSCEQLDFGAGENNETNKNLESVTAELSAGGDLFLVEKHMNYSSESDDEILDNSDDTDQTKDEMDSEVESEVVQQNTESKADILNNNDPKEVAEIAPYFSSGGAENKQPVTKTPSSVKGLNSVSDDKENIDSNGIKFELTKEEGAKTNLAMADTLTSLDIVQGIENFLNRSPERKAVTAAKVRRTTTRSKPIGNGSESVPPMMTQIARRTARRGISDEIMAESKTPATRNTVGNEDVEKKDVSDTPALVTYSRRNQKVSTVQRVYSTRRSARLTENIVVEDKQENIDSLVSELSRIDLGDVSDNTTLSVLQESAEKVDVVALETINYLKDNEALDEFNAVQEDNTKSSITENNKEGDVQEEIVEKLEESEQPQFVACVSEVVLQESAEKVDVVTLETVNDSKDNEALNKFNAVQEDNTKSLVTENKKEGDVQEDIVEELEESEQPQFVADCKEKVLGYLPVDTENSYEQTKSDEAAALETGTELKGNDDQKIVVDELKEKSEQCFKTHDESHFINQVNSNNVMIEDESNNGILDNNDDADQTEDEIDSEQCFNTHDESHFVNQVNSNSVMIEDKSNDGILDNNDDADQTEAEMDSEQCFNTDESHFVNQVNSNSVMTEDESSDGILDNNDDADQTEDEMDSEVVQQITESKAEITEFFPFFSSGGAENKQRVTKTPSSVKGLNSVSDDKENIGRNGIKFELTKEEGAKKDKKEIDPAADELKAKSLRELSKMLKEKLQISNNAAEEIGKVKKERRALQKLEDNCQR